VHAVVIREGELVWEEHPDPVAGDTELLVEVKAAGINGADLMQRRGGYPAPAGSPADIPGLELAGEVVAVGRQVTRYRPGDRVMAVVGGGGQATMATVDEWHALPVPDGIRWPEAGGFSEVFWTAYDALFTQCRLASGERVLVTGAAGGVGIAGVQLAAATGAEVVASVRSPALHAAVAELGAGEVIEPGEVTGRGPFDVVLELVGAASFPDAVAELRTGGRAVVIGVGSGAKVELDLLHLMGRRASICGSTLRRRSRPEKSVVAASVTGHVLPLLASGQVRVPVHATVPMTDATAGYEQFAAGGKLGKIVLMA